MQASRASSRALKHIAAGSKQTRTLHMTGPATFSNLLTSERPALNLPRDIAGLRAECSKYKLPTTGTKAELIDRLSAHQLTSSRTFSTTHTDTKRPTASAAAAPGTTPARHFNTSRTLKAVKDSSTIDFAYIPDFDPDAGAAPVLRVPILPETLPSEANKAQALEAEEPIIVPTIFTAAADGTHIHAPSALSDVTDNNSIDFQGMAAKVAEKFNGEVEETGSMVRQVWTGLVDDILGPKKQGA